MTLRHIAERANLSVSAVSMALQQHPRISADARARVQALARELGYVPNTAGRALRSQRSNALALIVPNTNQHVFGHAYFMHVLSGVTDVANERDYQLLVSTNPDEKHGKVAYERVMRAGTVDGVIVTSAPVADPNIARLVDSGLPVVLLGRYDHLPLAVSVGVDDIAAAVTMTEHLIVEHRRKSLVHISGPLEHQSAIDRRDGFLAACAAHGVRGEVVEGDYSEGSGAAAGHVIAVEFPDTDGVFAANDEMALSAMRRVALTGRSVSGDVSVVGFDDFGLSRVTTPSITTMHAPVEEMARLATRRLLDILRGTPIAEADTHAVLGADLVRRESCGCPPPL
ncbi:LacI family DNA-binding transcriptional regulator [Nakamurella sp. A5-74]|uniref:LacI family DNA-binding transcriptional regulator n=1 Tax=Nakamurella sp. A5-74 TaxID=3158264 RepID=A0AAU8DPB3_9ACTN